MSALLLNGIHMDFKYLCHRKSYLPQFLEELKRYGINMLLIELEDCFPYQKFPEVRSRDGFSPAELQTFLGEARARNFTLIPLVQSLGHLEFVLARPEYAALRETPEIHTQICPSRNEGGLNLVISLVDEVLAYFPDEPYFHIGGDEAMFLGHCSDCAKSQAERGQFGLWLMHESKVMRYLIGKGKRPIVWDDILWKHPENIEVQTVPKELILMSWNYVVSVSGKVARMAHLEFGQDDSRLAVVDVYRKAGFDVIGCPCCNYGQCLLPRHRQSLDNMRAWALKNRTCDLMGMLTSAWACFHVPLATQLPLYAASAALVKDPEISLDASWFAAWAQEFFGGPVPEFDLGLEYAGQLWELPMVGYGRSFSPLPYSYMNMVLGYSGGQSDRNRRGAYPLDWNEIDFVKIYRAGVVAAMAGDVATIRKDYERLTKEFATAVKIFAGAVENAVRHQDEAKLWLVSARLKEISLGVFGLLSGFGGNPVVLLAKIKDLEPDFLRVMEFCYEPFSVTRIMQVALEPLRVILDEEVSKN